MIEGLLTESHISFEPEPCDPGHGIDNFTKEYILQSKEHN